MIHIQLFDKVALPLTAAMNTFEMVTNKSSS